MASNAYITGRKKYTKPQAMLWADTEPVLENGLYLPAGLEILDSSYSPEEAGFIVLSDHNRDPIEFTPQRIEHRQRTINGSMRSYHVADKLTIKTGWSMLPSKSFANNPEFNELGKSELSSIYGKPGQADQAYTVDGGAGGAELLNWYNNHTGSFWVFLSYDNYKDLPDFGTDPYSAFSISRYTHVMEMFISDFQYSVEKRNSSNFDMWNISVTLDEA